MALVIDLTGCRHRLTYEEFLVSLRDGLNLAGQFQYVVCPREGCHKKSFSWNVRKVEKDEYRFW